MAAVYEEVGTYSVTRLRGTDTAFLAGADRPGPTLPDPIAVAIGPRSVIGPGSAVGALDIWGALTSIPAFPEIVWVNVSGSYILKRKTAVGGGNTSYFYAVASLTNPTNTDSPALGMGGELDNDPVLDTGTYLNGTNAKVPRAYGLWEPIDPAKTVNGFTSMVTYIAPAAGYAIDDVEINMVGCKYLGFPVNLWGAAALWLPASARGS
jgi:hypothetical protein